jgi:putative ABC transport system permease protein
MHFSQLVFKNVIRRRTRSFLTFLAIAAAIAAVVMLRGISVGFVSAFHEVYAAHGIHLVVTRQGAADRLSSSIDEKTVTNLKNLSEVSQVAGVLLETLSIEDRGVFGVPAMGLELNSWMLKEYPPRDQGTGFIDSQPKQVMLGAHLAERLQAKVNDSIPIFEEDFRVVGIFESPSVWENGSMILPLDELQQLTDRDGQVTYANIVLKDTPTQETTQQAVQSIKAFDAKLLPLPTEEFVNTDTRMTLVRTMAWLTSAIALVIGTIGTLNSVLTSVYERTQEIGILRAIGWTKSRVIAMILLESCGLAMAASLAGIFLAWQLFHWMSFSTAVRSLLPSRLDSSIMVEGVLLAIGMGVIGAWLPAWRAARLLPTEAFRHH